ncbi:MAG TPA: hypothetical protein PLL33_13230 [Paracoccus sp. (in: a-proteobacteria)]|nr:hypothetical protein [Paracoccus sp. (in: a-proteobacteria)]
METTGIPRAGCLGTVDAAGDGCARAGALGAAQVRREAGRIAGLTVGCWLARRLDFRSV